MLRKFFSCRHNLAPNGPDFWGKTGEKWPVSTKNRGILATCNLQNFICPKFSPVLDFSPRGPVRRPFSFHGNKNLPYFFSVMKRLRKSLVRRTRGALAPASPPTPDLSGGPHYSLQFLKEEKVSAKIPESL